MKALTGIITALSVPLVILNMLGGIVSGIWLAFLRDWRTIGLGIAFFFASTIILGFVLMPSMLLMAPAAYFAEKGKTIGVVCFGTLSSLYTLALIAIWCCGVLFLFVNDATASNIIPRLIWSYGVATGPWAYMASKEQGPGSEGLASSIATFLAQLAYLVIMVLVLITPITLIAAIKIFGGFMLVGLVLQITAAVMIQKERTLAERSGVHDE
jgi:hypothetical protein